MSAETLAELLYLAVTPQPRPSWGRLRKARRERFIDAIWCFVKAGNPFSVGVEELLRRQIRANRQAQLHFMRTGKRVRP